MNNQMQHKDLVCIRPWTSFLIDDHKGNVNPCCWSKIKSFGNINTSSVEEIWNGQEYVYIRDSISKGNIDLVCTKDCPILLSEYTEKIPLPISNPCAKNQKLQSWEIDKRKTTLESKPTRMRIVPTLRCNLNCVMCYQDRNDTVNLPANIRGILSSYFPVLQELLILGGEPLISKECLQIIESIRPQVYPDLHLALITNGTAVTDRIEQLLSKRLISWILVSIDAAKPETYKKIRQGNFKRVIEGTKRLKSIKDKQSNDWRLMIGFTMMRSNVREALAFVDLADALGVECVFTPVFGDWHEESFFYANKDELANAKGVISDLENYLESKKMGKIKARRLQMMIEETISNRKQIGKL